MSGARGKLVSLGNAVELEAAGRGGAGASTSGAATAYIGTTRNRTDLFLKYRRAARGSSKPLVADAGGPHGCVAGRGLIPWPTLPAF